jgi:hypothetical protein
MTYPLFHACNILFVLITFPVETFFTFVKTDITESKEKRIRQERKIQKRRFTKGLDPEKLAPLRKYHGYAFSGEAGHTPQVTDKLLVSATRKILAA